ncbi:MAG: protoheme IX farnesyltransferase [Deltaproteobacteria bacterium]|nr:protoheme IX farnesyltransferase [Deltaproteobacteria bacterium]MCB9788289.1 protoheme IX farnesyltransferase [Deltaproteobacteria bacterium]
MCLLMTGAGLGLAPGHTSLGVVLGALAGTALAVGSANALNMWWERHTDRLMVRTRTRPLAEERISPAAALAFGLAVGAAGLLLLALTTNLLTTALGAIALASYVLVYTPLKYHTPLALVIGAVPGAMPPLMGWTAVTDRLDAPGLVLFGILLLWQMPHFLAISLFRKHDYARAGIRIVPVVRGDQVARRQAVAWATGLVPVSLLLTPLGVTGTLYLLVALMSGLAFLGFAITGLRTTTGPSWAYRFFIASLVYLPLLTLGFVLDRIV